MMAPGTEPEENGPAQKYLISTPAGGKFIVSCSEVSLMMKRNAQPFASLPSLYGLFAKKVGDQEERLHFLPVGMCDISPYFEPAPETEPVGCATVEEPSSENQLFAFEGSEY